MRKVYKYSLLVEDEFTIEMPIGAELLSVQAQGDKPYLWALVDPNADTETRHFRFAGTGHDIESNDIIYVGTYQIFGGRFVGHLFEQGNE